MALNRAEQVVEVEEETLQEYANRLAVRLALAAGAVVYLLVVLLNMDRNPVPMLADWRSFGVLTFLSMLPLAFVVASIAFVQGVKSWNTRVGPERQRRWGPPLAPIALAYTLVAGFICVFGLFLAEHAFRELALITLQGAIISAGIAATLSYWVANRVMYTQTGDLLTLIVVIIAGGVYLTTATIDDPYWWQVSFSYLGKMESSAKTIFNITLIFTGILLLTWIGYFMSDFRILVRHGIAPEQYAKWVRYGLAALAIGVMLVGTFKSNYTPFSSMMHNLSAYSLGVAFALLMLGGRWFVPGFPKEYFGASAILVILLAGAGISAAIGRMNTVGLELSAFVIGMTWLSLFVRTTEQTAAKLEPDAFPHMNR